MCRTVGCLYLQDGYMVSVMSIEGVAGLVINLARMQTVFHNKQIKISKRECLVDCQDLL